MNASTLLAGFVGGLTALLVRSLAAALTGRLRRRRLAIRAGAAGRTGRTGRFARLRRVGRAGGAGGVGGPPPGAAVPPGTAAPGGLPGSGVTVSSAGSPLAAGSIPTAGFLPTLRSRAPGRAGREREVAPTAWRPGEAFGQPGRLAADAATIPMRSIARPAPSSARAPTPDSTEHVVDLAAVEASAARPAPAPAAVEISCAPTARFRTAADARLLCVPDAGVWLLSHVGGRARCSLGDIGVDLAALPITIDASRLEVREHGSVETIDLKEFASPGTDGPVALVDVGPARGPDHVLVAGTAAGVAAVLIAPPSGDGDHQLELLQWFADRIGRFWSVDDLGSHAGQALGLLLRDQVTRDVEFAIVGLRRDQLAVTMTPGVALVGAQDVPRPTDGLVTTLLPPGHPAEVVLQADLAARVTVDRAPARRRR